MATKRGNLKIVDAPAATTEAEQPPFFAEMRLILVFLVDGKPVINMPLDLSVPPVPDDAPEGTIPQAQIALDGRVLLNLLEPALGPTQASTPCIWVPGAPPPKD